MGVSMSNDGGDTWFSRLAPGYLGHPNSQNLGFAADPALVAIPGNSPGLAILNYIAANRGSNVGQLLVQRWVEYPQEDQDFWKPEDDIIVIADGSEGRFIDKPAFLYIVDLVSQQGTITQQINVEGEAPISVTTPTGTLIAVYAVFTGNGGSKVLLRKSFDNGLTWTQSEKISEEQNEVTGVSVTALGDDFVVVYRRRGDNNQPDAVMSSFCSIGGKKNCTKGEVMFEMCPFDQPASGSTHRTFSFPWAANDGKRFWAFAADRRFANDASCTPVPDAAGIYTGKPRIVGMSSANGKDWVGANGTEEVPFVLADRAEGFQVMPVAFGTKGRIDIAWYDTYREEVVGLPAGNNDILINDYATGSAKVARKADVWMTRLTANCSNNAKNGCTPSIENPVRVSQYPAVLETSQANIRQETKAHLPNWTLYASGTLAFNGDYISLATPPFRQLANGKFIPNSTPQGDAGAEKPGYTNQQNMYVAWGDNRDVEADTAIVGTLGQLPYTPPINSDANPGGPAVKIEDTEDADSIFDPGELVAASEPDDDPALPSDLFQCEIAFDYSKSRDSNIYGSRVVDAPTLVSPTPTKPLGTIQRMFPLEITNIDPVQTQDYCLAIANQPNDFSGGTGFASFYQLPSVAPFSGAVPLELLTVTAPGGSSVSRAAFVTTSDASTVITVNAYEGACPATTAGPFGPLINAVQLSDGALFDPVYCETNACAPVATNETHEISLAGPSLQAPVFEAPSFEAPVLEAPSFEAPSFEAPVLEAPSLEAPSLQAGTPMGDADPEDISIQDITYVVSMDSNVITTVSADIAVSGLDPTEAIVQLIAWTPNVYSTASECLAVPQANQQIIAYTELNADNLSSISLPTAFSPDDQDPYVGTLSFTGRPNQRIALTARFWVTGTARQTLMDLDNEYRECLLESGCDPEALGLGTQQLITFGASAHTCSTNDAEDNSQIPGLPDCLNNGAEKILQDRIGPVITLTIDSPSLEATGPGGRVIDYTATAVDNVDPAPSLSCSPASGTLFSLGTSTVTCNASDSASPPNLTTELFNITVVDTTAPTLNVPADVTVEATGPATVVDIGVATATDIVDTDVTITYEFDTDVGPGPMLAFPVGTTTVTWRAVDDSGNVETGQQFVTVTDTTAPEIFPPATVTVLARPGSGGADLNVGPNDPGSPLVFTVEANLPPPDGAAIAYMPTAVDAVAGMVAVSCMPASGSTFPEGTSIVQCSATDGAGNSTSINLSITVEDTTDPTFDVADGEIFLFEANQPGGAYVDLVGDRGLVATDRGATIDPVCVATPAGGGADITLPALLAPGDYNVVCSVDGVVMTTVSVNVVVDINDNEAPTITIPGDGTATVPALEEVDLLGPIFDTDGDGIGDTAISATDTVDSDVSITCDPSNGAFEIGTYTVTCTASDDGPNADGMPNTATAEFTLNVVFGFDIELIVPKGNARAGSTIPVDWIYLDGTGNPVDSADLAPTARWVGRYSDNNCTGASTMETDESEDSGSSSIRYSSSNKTWQLSWQTPDVPGRYKFIVTPPGENVLAATACVRLR
jgi:hypothetical protein